MLAHICFHLATNGDWAHPKASSETEKGPGRWSLRSGGSTNPLTRKKKGVQLVLTIDPIGLESLKRLDWIILASSGYDIQICLGLMEIVDVKYFK